jgi:hypothetical protein
MAAGAGLIALLAVIGQPARALEPMSDSDLDTVRGGFLTADGFTFSFGAVVSTYVNGNLALQTTLNLTSAGPAVTQTAGAIAGALPLSDAAAAGINLGSISGQGVLAPGNGGYTAIIQNLTQNQILSLIVNSASNQTILQNTAITLTIPNLAALKASATNAQVSFGLQNALAASTVLTRTH